MNFWIGELLKVLVLFASTFLLGHYLVRRGVRVNYTRKIFHFIFIFFPVFISTVLPFSASLTSTLISGAVVLVCLAFMVEPLRKKSYFLRTCFSAIDRPEDQPYTLLWVSTQLFVTYVVVIAMVAWLKSYDRAVLIYITVLIVGIGDGLAEPVGVRFGKHHYKVHALFTDRKYSRTLEGSLCVFVSGILAVILLSPQLSWVELGLALVLIPIWMTLAEAFSPHTWDGPLLYLIGGLSTVLIVQLGSAIGAS